MRKRIVSILASIVLVCSAFVGVPNSVQASKNTEQTFQDLNQKQIVEAMGPGWNLGNQLESVIDGVPEETNWGNPIITESLIKRVKKAGFRSIRIPVSYFTKIDDNNQYKIDSKWLDRIQEVVDYCMKNDMYAVINIHGDGYNTIDGGWLLCNGENQATIRKKYKKVWKQIATRFKDYDEHLLFESMNEEFDGNYSTPNKEYYENINAYNQIFVDTVRKTGGNNTKRWLIVTGWNTNIEYTVGDYGFELPTDKYRAKSISKKEQRIMISVHYYEPWDFCGGENGVITQWGNEATDASKTAPSCGEAYMERQFNRLKETFIDKGYPVFIGEYGSIDKSTYDSESEFYRAYFAKKLCEVSKETGCIPMYWDNGYNGVHGFGLFDRTTKKITQPAIIDAIMEGSGRNVKKNTEMMSVRLYVSDSYYWYTVQSDNIARITKKGGTYTLKVRGSKEMLSNITTISLRDCYVEQGRETTSPFKTADVVINKVTFNGNIYALKENKTSAIQQEQGNFKMELINQWNEAEPMITGLQKKDSFSFQPSQYQDENVLEVTFTVSNLS